MAGSKTISVSEVVAQNVWRLRDARGWRQAELADRLRAQTGKDWDHSMVSRAEVNPDRQEHGRRKRLRHYTPEELVALARVFQVPLSELFLVDDEQMVDMGGVEVRGDDFFHLVFWVPSERRRTLTSDLYGGFSEHGETEYETHHGFQFAWLRDVTRALVQEGTFHRQLLEAAADGNESALRAIQVAYMDRLGPELFNAVFGDERFWDQMRQLGGGRFTDLILEGLEEEGERK